jgi:hypothetical protein
MDTGVHYVGISGATLPIEEFDLGHGVWIRRTYAHFFSPCLMAFASAPHGKPNPGPWRAASGGFSFDITIELRISDRCKPGNFNVIETAAWIVALLRLGFAPYLSAPVTIDMPFSEAAQSEVVPTIKPLEVQEGNFYRSDERSQEIPLDELDWLKATWHSSAELAQTNPQLLTAVLACDSCRVRSRVSQSMITIWGALEQLFVPSSGELRHRVAANMAAYLEPRGPERLATYKQVMKLYNARSAAAHSTKEVDRSVMLDSWVILRNALIKMISEHHVPSQSDFEHLLYADVSPISDDAISWGIQSKRKPAIDAD